MSVHNTSGPVWGTLIQAHQISVHPPQPQPMPPRQLPAPRRFFDRDQVRAYLDRAWDTRHGPLWVALEGPSGIGKSAFVTDWAHHQPDRWPNGWLYADLAHSDLDTALRGWLTSLGQTTLPAHTEALHALWRTCTAHQRLLAVLDNTPPQTVGDALQLLPAGPGCAGVVIAHHGLSGLIAHGARLVRLAPLEPESVRDLIIHLVDRPIPEPALNTAVANASGFPLVAALNAVLICQNPRSIPEQLTPQQEKEPHVSDHVTHILINLPEHTALAATRLAVHPGPHLTRELAGALLATGPHRAQTTLDELTDAELLTDLGQNRYTPHHLVHPALSDQITPTDRTRVIERLCTHYRFNTAAADLVINPWRWRVDEEAITQVRQTTTVEFATADEALAWTDRELPNLLAVARMVANLGGSPFLWQLSDHLGTYIAKRKPMIAARELYQLGIEQAQTEVNLPALGLMHQRAGALAPDPVATREHAEYALEAYRRAGHQKGVASAQESLGGVYRTQGDYESAARMFADSERLHLELGRTRGAALQRRKLSEVRASQGRTEEALSGFVQAHRMLLELEQPDLYQATRAIQGAVDAAKESTRPVPLDLVELLCRQALHSARTVGSVHQQASLHTALADLARVRGNQDEERAALRAAQVLLEPTGHPDAVSIAERAARLA